MSTVLGFVHALLLSVIALPRFRLGQACSNPCTPGNRFSSALVLFPPFAKTVLGARGIFLP